MPHCIGIPDGATCWPIERGPLLGGDTGVTVEMSRVFQNGVRFGGYFTKTNVSSQQFGEGSFDKACM